MSAIEQGIITPTTKERLEELEEERRDFEGQITREEMKKPLLTKERIMYWLESFKRGDIERTAPPNSANPNSFFFVKHCVGFVFIVEDVG